MSAMYSVFICTIHITVYHTHFSLTVPIFVLTMLLARVYCFFFFFFGCINEEVNHTLNRTYHYSYVYSCLAKMGGTSSWSHPPSYASVIAKPYRAGSPKLVTTTQESMKECYVNVYA